MRDKADGGRASRERTMLDAFSHQAADSTRGVPFPAILRYAMYTRAETEEGLL